MTSVPDSLSAEVLDRIVSSYPGDWTADVLRLSAQHPKARIAKDGLKLLQRRAEAFLEKGQLGRVFNWCLLGVAFSRGGILRSHPFQDLFRPSLAVERPALSPRKLRSTVDRLAAAVQDVDAASSAALSSWSTFIDLFAVTRGDEHAALDFLSRTSNSMGLLLIRAEEAFMRMSPLWNPQAVPHPPDVLSQEEVATAASYLVAAYNRRYGIRVQDLKAGQNEPALVDAALDAGHNLARLHDLEALVFRAGYSCRTLSKAVYQISPPTPRVGMALELGHIRSPRRPTHQWLQENEVGVASFVDMFAQFYDRFGSDVLKVAEGPPRRLRLEVPKELATAIASTMLDRRGLYREDLTDVRSNGYELGSTWAEFERFIVTDDLTLMDIVMIGRVFRWVAMMRSRRLSTLRETDRELYLNSVLGGGKPEDIAALLEAFGIPLQNAKSYLSLFTWEAEQQLPFLDLQYSPFVTTTGIMAFPFCLHGSSNLTRNALVAKKKRLSSDADHDPVSREMEEVIRTRTPNVTRNLNYQWGDAKGDVDVLARIGGLVFAFECKNSLHPCSAFEMRTLVDHLDKAALQLDRFSEVWRDTAFRRQLAQRLQFDVENCRLVTGIITSPRLFSGAHWGGHPVRHVRECASFVQEGKAFVRIMDEVEKVVDLWRGEEFSEHVLAEYFSENTSVYGDIWASFSEAQEVLRFQRCQVQIARYGLDELEHLKRLAPEHYDGVVERLRMMEQQGRGAGPSDGSAPPIVEAGAGAQSKEAAPGEPGRR